jgi:hypothetical protein
MSGVKEKENANLRLIYREVDQPEIVSSKQKMQI